MTRFSWKTIILRTPPRRRAQARTSALSWALVIALSACSGSASKPAETPSIATPITTSTADATTTTPVAKRLPTRSPLSIFPATTNLLLSIKLPKLTRSPLYTEMLERWLRKEFASQLDHVKTSCDLDLLREIDTMLSAHIYDENMNHVEDAHMLALRGLSRKTVATCMNKLVNRKLARTFTEDGMYSRLQTETTDFWKAWLDDTTVVLGTGMDRKRLDDHLNAPVGLQDNVELSRLMDLTDRTATIWGIMRMPERADPGTAPFHSVYGWLHLETGFDLHLGFLHTTPEQAKKLTFEFRNQIDQFIGQAGELAKFIQSIEVTSRGTEMIVTLSYDLTELSEILKQLKHLVGAM